MVEQFPQNSLSLFPPEVSKTSHYEALLCVTAKREEKKLTLWFGSKFNPKPNP